MNAPKQSPRAAVKTVFASRNLTFLCVVFSLSALFALIQTVQNRVDFANLLETSFAGIDLNSLLPRDFMDFLDFLSGTIFVFSLLALLPQMLMAVGAWMLKAGTKEDDQSTKTSLIALNFFKINSILQMIGPMLLATILGVVSVIFLLFALADGGDLGGSLFLLFLMAIVGGIVFLVLFYHKKMLDMLVGVSNTLRSNENLLIYSPFVIKMNYILAAFQLFGLLGVAFGFLFGGIFDIGSLIVSVVNALCFFCINQCILSADTLCGFPSNKERKETMEHIQTDPAMAPVAEALGVDRVDPQTKKKLVSYNKGFGKIMFGLTIAPVQSGATVRKGTTASSARPNNAYAAPASSAPKTEQTTSSSKVLETRILTVFGSDIEEVDARFSLLGKKNFREELACPVTLKTALVVKDSVSEKQLARFDFQNISPDTVREVRLRIIPKTNDAKALGVLKDVVIKPEQTVLAGERFGANYGVILPDEATNGTVTITYVEFENGLYWDKVSEALLFATEEKMNYDMALYLSAMNR